MFEHMNLPSITSEVAVEETTTAPVAPAPTEKPEEKESIEDIFKRAAKPPADGPCKGCGESKPLNRLMLCFPCWVKKQILDEAKEKGWDWIPGDPHPSHCGCNLPEHNGGPRK